MVKIEIDPAAGFCFGVEQVIETATSKMRSGERLYGLGAMVHNQAEVDRLERLGLQTIGHEDLPSMGSRKVLIRAHGEPPSTYQLAIQHGVEVIDGTCPIVSSLQKRIRKVYEAMDRRTEQLVIFGKPDHPETIGLAGQVDGDVVVVGNTDDIRRIESGKKVYLFSQTTMDPDQFKEVENALREHLKNTSGEPVEALFRSECTICGQMKKRKPRLAAFAKNFEKVLFVSGKNSSNGRMLFEYCLSINPSTLWISEPREIESAWLEGVRSVGISGATSTSLRQLELVADRVRELTASKDNFH
jgi:4-hydroxy-3-methylbut-2-enyl diphosphate reductase